MKKIYADEPSEDDQKPEADADGRGETKGTTHNAKKKKKAKDDGTASDEEDTKTKPTTFLQRQLNRKPGQEKPNPN